MTKKMDDTKQESLGVESERGLIDALFDQWGHRKIQAFVAIYDGESVYATHNFVRKEPLAYGLLLPLANEKDLFEAFNAMVQAICERPSKDQMN